MEAVFKNTNVSVEYVIPIQNPAKNVILNTALLMANGPTGVRAHRHAVMARKRVPVIIQNQMVVMNVQEMMALKRPEKTL